MVVNTSLKEESLLIWNYLRWIKSPISNAEKSYSFLLKNFNGEISTFSAEVVEMIVGNCDSIKACIAVERRKLLM